MHAGDADVLGFFTMKTKSGVFSFEGRIGLEEYWGNIGVTIIVGFGFMFLAEIGLACFALPLLPCYLWYVLAFMSKRCHDLGNSGAIILNPFYFLVLAFGEGDVGANEYGPSPNDVAKQMVETVLAAEQGFARAQYNLGICYHDGKGVPRDEVEAVKWYRKAAEQGFAAAQFNLGICHFNGEGVAKDSVQAVSWYRKAAEQGVAEAQSSLGFCYIYGEGVAKDDVQAVSWYRKAADQGNAKAQSNLANRYAKGEGVAMDEIEAYAYWNLAGITHKPAREKLIILKKQMTDDQIAAGQQRTKELQKEIEAKIAAKQAGK